MDPGAAVLAPAGSPPPGAGSAGARTLGLAQARAGVWKNRTCCTESGCSTGTPGWVAGSSSERTGLLLLLGALSPGLGRGGQGRAKSKVRPQQRRTGTQSRKWRQTLRWIDCGAGRLRRRLQSGEPAKQGGRGLSCHCQGREPRLGWLLLGRSGPAIAGCFHSWDWGRTADRAVSPRGHLLTWHHLPVALAVSIPRDCGLDVQALSIGRALWGTEGWVRPGLCPQEVGAECEWVGLLSPSCQVHRSTDQEQFQLAGPGKASQKLA